MDTIECCLCKENKNISEFGSRKDAKRKYKYFCIKCDSLRKRKWERENPEKAKIMSENHKLKKFGITRDIYYAMHDEQKGLCAICQQPEKMVNRSGKIVMLAVDHCHKSDNVRGLLCSKCNTAIGLFQEKIEYLELAITYLNKHTIFSSPQNSRV